MLPNQLPLTSQLMLTNHLPLTSQPRLMTATTTVPAVGSYLPVVQPTATHAAAFVPTPANRTTIGTITQPAGYLMETQPSYQMISNTIPPVPAQIRQRITQGEFIDFAVLLHKATFPDAAIDPSAVAQQSVKKISSFAMWMQAWNIYLSVIRSHNPTKTLEMISYQSLICSANALLPLQSWLQYDAKFRTIWLLPILSFAGTSGTQTFGWNVLP